MVDFRRTMLTAGLAALAAIAAGAATIFSRDLSDRSCRKTSANP